MDDIAKRLEMAHLSEEQLVARTKREPKPKPPTKIPREHTFQINYTSETGQVYRGSFTTRALSVGEKIAVAQVDAELRAGLPPTSFTEEDRLLIRATSWMTIALIKRENLSPPGWADNLREITDEDLLYELFKEVSSHQASFLGLPASPERSSGEGKESGEGVGAVV
jgi:hypothetical protein